jgi:hypothetical protein
MSKYFYLKNKHCIVETDEREVVEDLSTLADSPMPKPYNTPRCVEVEGNVIWKDGQEVFADKDFKRQVHVCMYQPTENHLYCIMDRENCNGYCKGKTNSPKMLVRPLDKIDILSKDEKERNRRLLLLLQDLLAEEKTAYVELLATMVKKDTPAMKKSFEIMTNQHAPIWDFLRLAEAVKQAKLNKDTEI